jgi:hypothetical protein
MRGAGRPHGASPSCVYGCWRARALAPVAARSVGSLAVAYRSCACGAELVNVGPGAACACCRRPAGCWLVVDDEGRVAAAADEREAVYTTAFEAELHNNRDGLFVATS